MNNRPGAADYAIARERVNAERAARLIALREFETACSTIAVLFGDSPQRRVAITARGDMREANGEART